MNQREIDTLLAATLEDGRLSRGERGDVRDLLEAATSHDLGLFRSRVFALARAELATRPAEEVLAWCEAVLKLVGSLESERASTRAGVRHEAWFSPGDACPRRIVELVDGARRAIDVCVFTLTDDRIAGALERAHGRGVAIRMITDDDKAHDRGSDVIDLARQGIAVRTDKSEFHMHHKFALFDGATLLTGSYNWTRGADRDNEENFVVTTEPDLVRAFAAEFDKLWQRFG